ncbi:hypothetical protein O988_01070 [Pseudogymnoascus sp. VKM F-3808]|nr:hypothetical protein O988_01070 [Pseudogymnoascus sp. VKM F-3808]
MGVGSEFHPKKARSHYKPRNPHHTQYPHQPHSHSAAHHAHPRHPPRHTNGPAYAGVLKTRLSEKELEIERAKTSSARKREAEEEEEEDTGPTAIQLARKKELETIMASFKAKFTEINHEISDARAVVTKKKEDLEEAQMKLEIKIDKKRRANEKYDQLQAEWKGIPIARGSGENATARGGGVTTKGNGGAGGGVVTPNEKGGTGGGEIGTGEDMELDQEKLRGQGYL